MTYSNVSPSSRPTATLPSSDEKRSAVIPDAAHSPQFENPTAWWEAVAPFLAAELLVD